MCKRYHFGNIGTLFGPFIYQNVPFLDKKGPFWYNFRAKKVPLIFKNGTDSDVQKS